MTDTSRGKGWWQASDDQWYPPESHPNYRPPPPPVPQGVPSIESGVVPDATTQSPKQEVHTTKAAGGGEGWYEKGAVRRARTWLSEHGFPFSLKPLPIVTGIVVALMAIGGIAFAASGSSGAPSAAPPDTTTAATDPPTTTTVAPPTTTTVPPTTTTTTPPGITKTITTPTGWSYKVNFAFDKFDPSASPSGCYQTPPPGETNAWFTVTVTNLLLDRAAPAPGITFAANLNSDGTAVDPNAIQDWSQNVNSVYGKVEVTPGIPGVPCFLDDALNDGPSGQIPAGSSARYTVYVSSVPNPLLRDLALLVWITPSNGTSERFSVPAQG
jgi:hypothetical protein